MIIFNRANATYPYDTVLLDFEDRYFITREETLRAAWYKCVPIIHKSAAYISDPRRFWNERGAVRSDIASNYLSSGGLTILKPPGKSDDPNLYIFADLLEANGISCCFNNATIYSKDHEWFLKSGDHVFPYFFYYDDWYIALTTSSWVDNIFHKISFMSSYYQELEVGKLADLI